MVIIMNNNFNIGKRIHELRLEHGLSQEQLALQAEITPTYLGQIERNLKNPTVHIVEKICSSMNVSLADFFSPATEIKEIDLLSKQILSQITNRTDDEKKIILNIIKQIFQLYDFTK